MGLHRFRGLVSGFLGSGSNRNYRFEGLGGSGILVNPRPMQRTVQGEKPVPSSECNELVLPATNQSEAEVNVGVSEN